MDHLMIESWNSRVQPDDTVYILGDFSYRSEKELTLNAGCMINNYMPVSFEELIRNNKIFQEESLEY